MPYMVYLMPLLILYRMVLACVDPLAVSNSSVSSMNVLLDMPVSSFSTPTTLDKILTTSMPTQTVTANSTSTTVASTPPVKKTSPITEFLKFPQATPRRSKGKKPGPARVLTSQESLEMFAEKERKKKEEEEAKERKKREREEKRILKEEEKKKKAAEKEKREEERKRKAEEKAKERELKLLEKKKKEEARKENKKEFMTRSKKKAASGPQMEESTSNECTVCFGEYADDLTTDGAPVKSWVQCTDEECKKWMHEDCVSKDSEDNLACPVCGSIFS